MDSSPTDQEKKLSLREAAEELLHTMDSKDLEELRAMQGENLPMLHFSLGGFIRNHFKLWSKDSRVDTQCGFLADPDDLSFYIIEELATLLEQMPTIKRQ